MGFIIGLVLPSHGSRVCLFCLFAGKCKKRGLFGRSRFVGRIKKIRIGTHGGRIRDLRGPALILGLVRSVLRHSQAATAIYCDRAWSSLLPGLHLIRPCPVAPPLLSSSVTLVQTPGSLPFFTVLVNSLYCNKITIWSLRQTLRHLQT